jgi:hypothetical protein
VKIKKPVNKKNIDKYFNQYRADAPVEQGGNTPPLQSAKTGHEQTLTAPD